MKFQNPSIHHSKVNTHTDAQTHRHTDKPKAICPSNFFKVGGIKIEFVQRRAARCVSNDYSAQSSVKAMLGNLGWWSLENRRIYARLTLFYKVVYGLVAIPLPSYFVHPEVYTRHMHSLSYS